MVSTPHICYFLNPLNSQPHASSKAMIKIVNGVKNHFSSQTAQVNTTAISATKTHNWLKLSSPWLKAAALTATLGAMSVPAYAACQVPKSYYSNVFCTSSSNHFLALKDSGQPVALLDNRGRRVADLSRYTGVDVSKISEGLIPVQRMGKLGYVNLAGREIIPAVYDVIRGDSQTRGWARAANGNRIVVKKGGMFGVIDIRNTVVLPFSPNYVSISDFSGNRAKITTRAGTQWIDAYGKAIAAPASAATQSITARNPSTPVVKTTTNIKAPLPSTTAPRTTVATSQSAIEALNALQRPEAINSGPVVAPMSSNASSGPEIWQPEQRDGKWGFVNYSGVPMITFSFNQVTPFSEGLAGVRMGDKWGFVNLAGELVIPFNYTESTVQRIRGANYKGVQPFMFTGGKAWVGNTANGAQMCIDTEGKYVSC